jgi:hypothetical protein
MDVDERFEKQPLVEKSGATPMPVCTLLSDGSLRVEGSRVGLVELHRMLLMHASAIAERTVQRAAAMEQVLARIEQRFSGFDADTARALASVLGQTPPDDQAG